MNSKRNRIITFVIFWGIILFLFGYIFLSPRALKASKNEENSKKIVIGMKKIEVLKIMGTPANKRISFQNPSDSMYYYEPTFAASDGIYISFDKTEKVTNIILNE